MIDNVTGTPTGGSNRNWRETIAGLSFASPWIVGFAALFLWPFAISLYWSFCRYDLVNEPQLVGTENYRQIASEISQGTGFGLALANTAYYILISVPLSVLLGVVLASWLSANARGQSIYRTIIFLPSMIPVVAASVLWLWLLNPTDGWVNSCLGLVGIPPQNWLNQSRSMISGDSLAMISNKPFADWRLAGSKDGLILMTLWGLGNYVVIYLAAIGDVPRALHEAASIDGAGVVRRWLHVTIPMLSPLILFHFVVGMIRGVQTFTSIYLLSEGTGQPGGSLNMVSLQMFLAAFEDLRVGYASAIAWCLFVILGVATYLLFKVSSSWVHYRTTV